MVALEFNALYFDMVVLLSALAPGLALGIPFLRKSDLSKLEKLMLCFFIGVVLPPSMLVIESLAGIKFSLFTASMNIFLLTAAGVFYGMGQNAFSFKLPGFSDDLLSFESARKHAASAFLLIVILLSFWIRIQTFTPIYSELDPYFYAYGSGQIVRFGDIPSNEDTAWWPEVKASHRNFPQLKMYLEAQWYSLYTGGGDYVNYLLFVTSSWLPPISAALMAFGAYLLFSSCYGKRYGLLAAFFSAFLPITIFKMSAGVNEAAPFGMASIFLVFGLYAFALRKGDLRMAAVAGLAMFACAMMSSYSPVIIMPFSAFIILQSLYYFMTGHKESESFFMASALLAAGFIFCTMVYSAYLGGILNVVNIVFSGTVLICIFSVLFSYAVMNYSRLVPAEKRKAVLALAAIIFAIMLLVPNPAGKYMKLQIAAYIGAADYNVPLERTIAEQNAAGASFESEAGFLALVPNAHIVQSPDGVSANVSNAIYSVLGVVSDAFSMLGNALLQASSVFFNAFLGTKIVAGAKTSSLFFFFLTIASAGFVLEQFGRKGERAAEPSIPLLMLLLMFPITYIGLIKIKFSILVGIGFMIAAVCAVAYLERFAAWALGKIKIKGAETKARYGAYALCVLLILAQIYIPSGFSMMILSKSFEMRYQDDPAALMPKMTQICGLLNQKGYADPEICAAGSDIHFADTINGQFNSKVCLVSQLSEEELFPAADAASQQKSGEARAGASFRCNRLADYWVDSMEWISKNVPPDGRINSWWDYGHWTNYFGNHKTVLRNEHASKGMIGRVAHDFLIGSTQDLVDSMNYFDSQYVLFDVELIGGSPFGGKYGALNYLGCAHEGETSVLSMPGTSDCEFEHSPEKLVVPKVQLPSTTCAISESQQRNGVLAYRVGKNGADQSKPVYCVGEIKLSTGEQVTATYYLDKKDENGDLLLSKGFMRKTEESQDYFVVEMVYNEAKVWPDGKGGYADGMEDAKTDFYKSNLYKGFYLENLPGFELVYKSKNGEVKIYKLLNFTGNKEGWVDPVASKMTQ